MSASDIQIENFIKIIPDQFVLDRTFLFMESKTYIPSTPAGFQSIAPALLIK